MPGIMIFANFLTSFMPLMFRRGLTTDVMLNGHILQLSKYLYVHVLGLANLYNFIDSYDFSLGSCKISLFSSALSSKCYRMPS